VGGDRRLEWHPVNLYGGSSYPGYVKPSRVFQPGLGNYANYKSGDGHYIRPQMVQHYRQAGAAAALV